MSEARTSASGGMETSYGFVDVEKGQKQDLVNEVFHNVAKRYDIMNDGHVFWHAPGLERRHDQRAQSACECPFQGA